MQTKYEPYFISHRIKWISGIHTALLRPSNLIHHPIRGTRGSTLHYTAWAATVNRLVHFKSCSQSSGSPPNRIIVVSIVSIPQN